MARKRLRRRRGCEVERLEVRAAGELGLGGGVRGADAVEQGVHVRSPPGRGRVSSSTGQLLAGAGEADGEGGGAAAGGAGGVGGGEAFPGDEADRLALALAQRGERCGQAAVAAEALRGIAVAPDRARTRPSRARLAAVVGEHLAGHGVQPRQRVLDPPRQLAPRDGEGLGREILDLIPRRPAREVRADGGVMGLVDRAERLRIAHTPSLSRSRHVLHAASTSAALGADTRSKWPGPCRFPGTPSFA